MPNVWRNRIVATGEESPDQLLANPANARIHPKFQQDALAAVLDDIGFIQTVIVNRLTGHVVDGHLRVGLAISRNESTIPVSYVELTPEEERKALTFFDPIGALAVTDHDQLQALATSITVTDATLVELLGKIADGAAQPVEFAAAADTPVCPHCGQKIRKKRHGDR